MSTNFPIFHPLNLRKNRFMKRLVDILFSLTFLCLVFPFILILVLVMTTVTMPGRIFFVQKRTGLNGKIFKCIKFRSMRVNSESHHKQATYGDRRITKWGFFMRKTNIDETPQFINVLLGDMSIVGPRPHMVKHTDEYSEVVEGYMQRHFVKPGVTGLSQIKGYRGEITKLSDIRNRVRLDVFYIKHWSLRMDMSIIIRTFFKCFGNDRKAY